MNVAVIDLGSNTFHILISKVEHGEFSSLYRERVFVGLSEGGIDQIKEERIAIGLDTCQRFYDIMYQYDVSDIRLVGTAVLRKASNRLAFIKPCEDIFGVQLEVIDGLREAELIYKGVQLLGIKKQPYIITDIGGGSVEFILVTENTLKWSASFEIGVGVLHALFHKSEPISQDGIEEAKAFIRKELLPLQKAISGLDIAALVGASGSFEVIKSINGYPEEENQFDLQDVLDLSATLKVKNLEERLAIEGLPKQRAKLIVVALILIEVVAEIVKPSTLIFSPFALKEGILNEIMHGK